MRHRACHVSAIVVTVLALGAANARGSASGAPTHLQCEFLENPLGIDVLRPRFSWWVGDDRRGAHQTAYRILVASTSELLRDERGDVWDSGKVDSDALLNVVYAGAALHSRHRYHWMVRTWDGDGRPLPWSERAFFETGFLSATEWSAKWIGRVEPADTMPSLDGVKWIWTPEGDPRQAAPAGDRFFRFTFDLPSAAAVESATLFVVADNSFRAFVNGRDVGAGSDFGAFTRAPVEIALMNGRNVVAIRAHNDNGPAALAALLTIAVRGEATSRCVTDERWRCTDVAPTDWSKPLFDDSTWKAAKVVGRIGDPPWGEPSLMPSPRPAVHLRRSFALSNRIRSARAYVTALGSYQLRINGQRVGNDVLTPDWTDYRQRVAYQTYDVTTLIRSGDNVIGAILGDGWYGSSLGPRLRRFNFGEPPLRLLVELHLQFDDGTEETIASDASWKTAPSPILRSEIYAGETYDARLEMPGWDSPGFDDGTWRAADVLPASQVLLVAQRSPPIRIEGDEAIVRPRAIATPQPGVFVFDVGQNMVGWVRLIVSGAAGTSVRLRFAERLQPDGNLDRANLRRAEATDTYVLSGRGREVFEPHFTYHGFRFVEVTGYPGTPTLESIQCCVVHSALPFTGAFECSDPTVNRLFENILWSQRGNLLGVPTDCPQRDERLGWMGDAAIFWRTACFDMDMAAFTTKWMRDVVDAQSPAGAFSDVSPRGSTEDDGAPAWGDAGIIVPYRSLRQYADVRLVEECWPAMEKWMAYIRDANPNLVWEKRRNHDFGYRVAVGSETPREILATAFWAQDAAMMAEMARAIGNEDVGKRYDDLFVGIRAAFIQRFVKDDGTVGNGSQTCQVLALQVGLVPEDKRVAAAILLARDIERHDGHLTTGFIGTGSLMPVLSESGRNDVAYSLLLSKTFPSWGYEIAKGATSIWERWNGDAADASMNSFNHYAFGAVGEWLYRYVAGIDVAPGAHGFKAIVVHPRLDVRLTHARATYDSRYGPIVSGWSRTVDGKLVLDVHVPANATATVFVPAASADRVTEGGRPARSQPGITFMRMDDGCVLFAVGAGSYRFAVE
ncbi:MAG: family 78 glycoside hydrolase catalytic domain [Planctomycetes bacterium]|nr:family 78 glycoside hydrolase catalytic domain [Planctomycetota bacterium]